VTPDGAAFVVLVSGLAAHTRDMRADPRVSLLVAQAEGDGAPAQALARLTVVGEAHAAEPGSPEAAACSAAYLARFPDAARLLAMADFSFFAIRPKSARWVGGFAQAMNVDPATLARTLAAG
jgi:putative heme iron utilization protein